MPYCGYLDNAITITPSSKFKPCCHMQLKNPVKWKDFQWTETTNFQEIKNQMQGKNWSPVCHTCYEQEQKYGESSRTRFNKKYQKNNTGIIYWDLKINNTCNLACRSCGPESSSTWNNLVLKHKQEFQKYNYNLSPVQPSDKWHRRIDEIIDRIHDNTQFIKTIKFTGGEPFLIPQVKEILNTLIEKNVSNNIELSFITNGQVSLLDDWYELLKRFAKVKINVSVDGTGSRYEYIRPGASWNKLENFIHEAKKQQNIALLLTFLHQTLNAADLENTIKWSKEIGIPFTSQGILVNPSFLNFSSLNNELRKKYNVETNTVYDSKQFEKLVNYMEILDRIHGTDVRKECPELFK